MGYMHCMPAPNVLISGLKASIEASKRFVVDQVFVPANSLVKV